MKSLTINTFNTLCKNINIVFLFLCFANLPVNAATLKVNNGFESGDLGAVKCSGNCPKISITQKKSGKYSAKFSLDRTMPTAYRTEVVLTGNNHSFLHGKVYWMSMDYRYEDWKKDSKSGEMAPFQVHGTPAKWGECKGPKGGALNFPFWMLSKNDEVVFNTYKGRRLWTGPVEKKKWLNIVVHFRISYNNDGFIEAWKDGKKLGRVDGPNIDKYDHCNNLRRSPFLKMGVYKGSWRPGRKITESNRRELYIDNFKLAEGENGYSLVSSSPASITPKLKKDGPL